MKRTSKAALLCAITSLVSVAPIGAEVMGQQMLEEIIVTARRREENLQTAPVAVTAVTADMLAERGAVDLQSVSRMTPNLTFTPGQGGNSGNLSAYIRGVGEGDFIITTDSAVATYIDGVYIARSFGASTQLLDVERIEVLRGPQGTLFGKNTIGGALVLTSKKPGPRNEVEADLTYGSYNSITGRGRISGPINDVVSASIAVLGKRSDGWQKRAGGNQGDEGIFSGRAQLRVQQDKTDIVLSLDGVHQRQHSAPHGIIFMQPTTFSTFQTNFIAPCCTVPASIDRTEANEFLSKDEADGINVGLTIDQELDVGAIKSISAYRYVTALFGRDGDGSLVNYAGDVHNEQQWQISQELQYSASLMNDKLRFLGGAYFFQERAVDDTMLYVAEGLYNALLRAGQPLPLAQALDFNIDFHNTQKVQNFGFFGNVTYQVMDKLSVDLGARWTHEKKDFFQRSIRVASQLPLLAGTPSYTLDKSWSNFSPKGSVSYQATENVMAYASVSRGFRSGGFNGRPTSLAEVGSFNPETITSFEGGLKGDYLDKRLRLNLAGYLNKYKGMQLLVLTQGAGGIPAVRIENAGKATIRGFEAEANAILGGGFSLDGSLGYLDTYFTDYMSGGVDNRGLKRRLSPKVTAAIGGRFSTMLSPSVEATARVDMNYRSSYFLDNTNSPYLKVPATAFWNAGINFRFEGTGFEAGVRVDNIGDKRVLQAGFDARSSFGFVEGYYTPPRRVFGTVRYKM